MELSETDQGVCDCSAQPVCDLCSSMRQSPCHQLMLCIQILYFEVDLKVAGAYPSLLK